MIKHKPITNKEYLLVVGYHPILDLSLNTGCRIAEIKRLIDNYNGQDYLDIKTKYSGDNTNRIFFNNVAKSSLEKLYDYKFVSKRTLSRLYKKLSNEIGVKFTSHNLRATFATRLIETGVDLVTVSRLMNHKDVSITAKYVQFAESRMRTAIDLLINYETINGMTIFELQEHCVKLNSIIYKLENKLKEKNSEK